jgi:hypothetical protein
MLQPAPDGLDQAVPSELDVSWIADGVLRDRALVRHLVELRARRCAASAAVAAAKARLALLEEQDRRLRARTANLGFKTASGEGDSPILFGGAHKIGTVPGGFETASQLDRGSKQPLFARLEIEQLRAELLASEEQLHATRLEEVRFAIQAAAQADANRRQPQYKTTVVNSRRRLTTADSEGDSPKRFSDCFLAGIAGCSTPQLAFYVAPYRPQSSTVTDEPRWLIGERAFATSMYWPRYPGMNRDGLDDRHLRGVETSYTIPVYADFYSFGTRRPDLSPVEGRATSFGGPWFFPGAPTNFR